MKNKLGKLLLLTIFLGSCATFTERQVENPSVSKSFEDITVNLTVLTKEELSLRHGSQDNPFLSFPGLIPPKDPITLELVIGSPTKQISLPLNDISLTWEEKTVKPLSRFKFKEFWAPYLRDEGNKEAHINYLINENIKDGEVTINPEKPLKTYLVFLSYLPKKGTMTIQIPMTIDQSQSGIAEFEFNFDQINAKTKGSNSQREKPIEFK